MKNTPAPPSRYRLQHYLALSYALFIVYVSLTPFSGWQDQGLLFSDVLLAPLEQTFTWFDAVLNCLAYMPLGFMLAYMLRPYFRMRHVILLSTCGGLALSALMEYTQMYLPARVSSNMDMLNNSTGAFIGALCALLIARHAWFSRVNNWHKLWFKHGRSNDFGLALAAMWLFAQTNPSLPMLGSVFIREVARWQFDIVPVTPFNWLESAVVALNLLLLGILLFSLLRERRHTLGLLMLVLGAVTLIKFLAAAVLLKSWALLLWLNSEAMLGILAGWLLLMLCIRLPRRWLLAAAGLAAVAYLLLVRDMLLNSAPATAMRLFHWHYIHMLNYNGFTQLVNMLFPLLLLLYLWRSGIKR